MNKQTKVVAGTVGAAVVGVAVGIAAGVLSAPASGRETRRRIGRKIEDQADVLKRDAGRAVVKAKAVVTGALARRRAKTA